MQKEKEERRRRRKNSAKLLCPRHGITSTHQRTSFIQLCLARSITLLSTRRCCSLVLLCPCLALLLGHCPQLIGLDLFLCSLCLLLGLNLGLLLQQARGLLKPFLCSKTGDALGGPRGSGGGSGGGLLLQVNLAPLHRIFVVDDAAVVAGNDQMIAAETPRAWKNSLCVEEILRDPS